MTIGKKLILGFGGVLILMLGATAFAVGNYLKTAGDYEVFTEKRVHQMHLVGELELEFKKASQAWKNLLLRGHDPAKLAQYRDEFNKQGEVVRQLVVELKNGSYQLLNEENRRHLSDFEEEYKKVSEKYAAALKVYTEGAGGNYKEADALVVGIDRSLTQLLGETSDKALEVTEQMLKDQAKRVKGLGLVTGVIAAAVFLIGVLFTIAIIRSIVIPLKALMQAAEFVAAADLSHTVKAISNDEIGDLATSFSDMITGLRAIVAKLQEATGQITSAGNEILAASQQQASAAREQSSAVTETTAAAKELSATSESVGESIKKVAQVAAHAMAGMSKIKESIDKTNGMLNSLGEKSQKIGKITELIDDVADQTNLLAVNASIEAARAGEQGRGFTVVADEIRKLADSTAKSTKDITSLIELIQHEMSNAIMSMETSIQNVDEEARLAQQTTEKSKEIAMTTHQQISGAKQISEAMMNIDETMKQVAAGAQQSQVSVKQLTALAGELKAIASKFKL
jgi:methyl-accepting chemotaxis protein